MLNTLPLILVQQSCSELCCFNWSLETRIYCGGGLLGGTPRSMCLGVLLFKLAQSNGECPGANPTFLRGEAPEGGFKLDDARCPEFGAGNTPFGEGPGESPLSVEDPLAGYIPLDVATPLAGSTRKLLEFCRIIGGACLVSVGSLIIIFDSFSFSFSLPSPVYLSLALSGLPRFQSSANIFYEFYRWFRIKL